MRYACADLHAAERNQIQEREKTQCSINNSFIGGYKSSDPSQTSSQFRHTAFKLSRKFQNLNWKYSIKRNEMHSCRRCNVHWAIDQPISEWTFSIFRYKNFFRNYFAVYDVVIVVSIVKYTTLKCVHRFCGGACVRRHTANSLFVYVQSCLWMGTSTFETSFRCNCQLILVYYIFSFSLYFALESVHCSFVRATKVRSI